MDEELKNSTPKLQELLIMKSQLEKDKDVTVSEDSIVTQSTSHVGLSDSVLVVPTQEKVLVEEPKPKLITIFIGKRDARDASKTAFITLVDDSYLVIHLEMHLGEKDVIVKRFPEFKNCKKFEKLWVDNSNAEMIDWVISKLEENANNLPTIIDLEKTIQQLNTRKKNSTVNYIEFNADGKVRF